MGIGAEDYYLTGPFRLMNAKVTRCDPRIQVSVQGHAGTVQLLTRGGKAGQQLFWSYGCLTKQALERRLQDQQPDDCCKVRHSLPSPGPLAHRCARRMSMLCILHFVAQPLQVEEPRDLEDVPDGARADAAAATPVDAALAAGSLVLVEGCLQEELQHHLQSIRQAAKQRRVAAWQFTNSRALRGKKTWP